MKQIEQNKATESVNNYPNGKCTICGEIDSHDIRCTGSQQKEKNKQNLAIKCSDGDSFEELSKKAALKDHYICDDEIGDEFCTRLKCKLCNGSDINGEPNGYGCEWRDKYLETNEELLVDFDTAYFLQTKKIDALEKEKADVENDFWRLKGVFNSVIIERDELSQWVVESKKEDLFKNRIHKINKLEVREKKLVGCMKQIAKYETCWKCEYYIGASSKYCNPPTICNINTRDQFTPVERSKILAARCLKELGEI